jgi:hypothetical protein
VSSLSRELDQGWTDDRPTDLGVGARECPFGHRSATRELASLAEGLGFLLLTMRLLHELSTPLELFETLGLVW